MPPSSGIVAINESDQIAMVGQWRYVYNSSRLRSQPAVRKKEKRR
jgi:hypothetical protein